MTTFAAEPNRRPLHAPTYSGQAPQRRDASAAGIKVKPRPAAPIAQLPEHLLGHILARLPPADMLVASGVCRTWRTATGEMSLLSSQLQKVRQLNPTGLAQAHQATLPQQDLRHVCQGRLLQYIQGSHWAAKLQTTCMYTGLTIGLGLQDNPREESIIQLVASNSGVFLAAGYTSLLWFNSSIVLISFSLLGVSLGIDWFICHQARQEAQKNVSLNAAVQNKLSQVTRRLMTPQDAAPQQLRQALVAGVHCMRAARTQLLPALDAFAADPYWREKSHGLCQMAHLVLPLGEAERHLSPSQIGALFVAATERRDLGLVDWLRPSIAWGELVYPGAHNPRELLRAALAPPDPKGEPTPAQRTP